MDEDKEEEEARALKDFSSAPSFPLLPSRQISIEKLRQSVLRSRSSQLQRNDGIGKRHPMAGASSIVVCENVDEYRAMAAPIISLLLNNEKEFSLHDTCASRKKIIMELGVHEGTTLRIVHDSLETQLEGRLDELENWHLVGVDLKESLIGKAKKAHNKNIPVSRLSFHVGDALDSAYLRRLLTSIAPSTTTESPSEGTGSTDRDCEETAPQKKRTKRRKKKNILDDENDRGWDCACLFVDLSGSRDLDVIAPVLNCYEWALRPTFIVCKSFKLKRLLHICTRYEELK